MAGLEIRRDRTAVVLRKLARAEGDARIAWRMLAIANALCGMSRKAAAEAAGMDRQTLRDWVHRFNDEGPDGLVNHTAPGAAPKLTKRQKAKLAALVEQGPMPAIHGVVRWRAVDLMQWIYEEFGISVSDSTVYRLLDELGFSHVSARPKAYKQNEAVLEAFKKTSPTKWQRSAPKSVPQPRSRSGSKMR